MAGSCGLKVAYFAAASAVHFFMKLFLAAPASFLSFALAAHAAFSGGVPASAWHFFMKLFLAAPASFFSAARAAQSSAAWTAVAEKAITNRASSFFIKGPLEQLKMPKHYRAIRRRRQA